MPKWRWVSPSATLPHKCYVHFPKRHACQANATSTSPSATTPATQSAAAPRVTNGDRPRHQSQPSAISATPAMQNEGWCEQMPRRPCQRQGGWRQVPRLPCKNLQKLRPCRQVPRLPRLPRKYTVYVAEYHACHAKCRGAPGDQQGPSAPPEPAQCHKCHPATQNEGRCREVPRQVPVCDKVVWPRVCERWCVTKLCVTKLCVKDSVWQSCVWEDGVWQSLGWKMACDNVVWRRRRRRRRRRRSGIQNHKQEPHTKIWGNDHQEPSRTCEKDLEPGRRNQSEC